MDLPVIFVDQLGLDSPRRRAPPKQIKVKRSYNQDKLEAVQVALKQKHLEGSSNCVLEIDRTLYEDHKLDLALALHTIGPYPSKVLLENDGVIANTIELPESAYQRYSPEQRIIERRRSSEIKEEILDITQPESHATPVSHFQIVSNLQNTSNVVYVNSVSRNSQSHNVQPISDDEQEDNTIKYEVDDI